ncbi:MAG: ATP-binding cassette domain-containing protein, partial [Deltaproteobacteria bacterium]|nr:ATP-binding cassette domain-containing protein [Deltaproteobacteria bacterium]
ILHPYRITNALTLNKEVRSRAVLLAQQMGIGTMLKRHANDLSHGEKQRAAISRALLPYPKLILSDEATGNLDPDNKTRILDLLFKSVEEHEATLLAVTHDYELLKRFDRVVDFRDFGF